MPIAEGVRDALPLRPPRLSFSGALKTPTIWGRWRTRSRVCLVVVMGISVILSGCTSFQEYVHNGFKVGPNYTTPPAQTAADWIDANDKRVHKDSDDLAQWWTVFHDPALNELICLAHDHNLTLRQAGLRILQARALLAISKGELLPQSQTFQGSYSRNALSLKP